MDEFKKYIEEMAPWALAKDPTKEQNLKSVMSHLANIIFVGTKLLEPVLIEKSQDVYKMLGLTKEETDYNNISNIHILDNHKVQKGNALFPRLDVAKESEYIKSLMGGKK